MKKTLIIIVVVILLAVLVIFLNKKPTMEVPTQEVKANSTSVETGGNFPQVAGEQTENVDSVPSDISKEVAFMVNGGNFYFKPNIIKVKEGDIITVTFKNDEGFHDFVIDEFNVATKSVASGGEEIVTFVANKKGSFEYYCSIGTHRQMGMKGTLIVE